MNYIVFITICPIVLLSQISWCQRSLGNLCPWKQITETHTVNCDHVCTAFKMVPLWITLCIKAKPNLHLSSSPHTNTHTHTQSVGCWDTLPVTLSVRCCVLFSCPCYFSGCRSVGQRQRKTFFTYNFCPSPLQTIAKTTVTSETVTQQRLPIYLIVFT